MNRYSVARLLAVGLGGSLLAAACVGSDDADEANESVEASTTTVAEQAGPAVDSPGFDGTVNVVVANTAGTVTTVGSQRIMTALVGDGPNSFLGGPDRPVSIVYSPLDGEAADPVEGEWLTTNASALGLYVSHFEFPTAGLWEVKVNADGEELGGALIEVVDESPVPKIGDPAPRTTSPTGATIEEVGAISTDPSPEISFYKLSVAEAVENGQPTVVVFATPAFCQTALCGPTIEIIKASVQGRTELDVVHVEPFDLELAPQGTLQPIPSMTDWGLVTEPWVFVIDAEGKVAASFEGIIGQSELDAALDAL